MPPAASITAKLSKRRQELVPAVLTLCFLLVLGVGAMLLHRVATERDKAAQNAERVLRTARESGELVPALTELYALGVEPPVPPGMPQQEEARLARLREAETEFERRAAKLEASLAKVHEPEVREVLLTGLRAVRSGAQGMMRQTAALSARPPRRPEGPEGRFEPGEGGPRVQLRELRRYYNDSIKAYQELSENLRKLEGQLFHEQEKLGATFLNWEYAVGGILILLMSVAAIYFRKRARMEHRMVEEKEELLVKMREAEVKYRSIFDNAVEGIFQTTPEGRFVTANRALARMYGYDSPEQLIDKLTDIPTQLYVEPAQRQALLEALKKSEVVSNFEFEVLRADGRTMWVRENVRAVRDPQGELLFLEGTVEDVSGLWWGEQRRRLQYATARVLGEAASVDQARPQILRTICETLEWDLGAVWDTNAETGEMRCVEVWHVPAMNAAEFQEVNATTPVRRGEGLAGIAWLTGEPRWIADLHTAVGYANAELALRCGMSSAFAVPVQVGGHVLHVLEFFSPKISLPDPELLQTLGAIASQLGHLIERKRAEEALRKSEMRKAAILYSALDCIITFDLEGKIMEFNPAAERAFGHRQAEVLDQSVSELIFPHLQHGGEPPGLALYKITNVGTSGLRRELVATRADGSELPVEMAISRIIIGGKPMFTAYLRDITERKEAERLTSELALVVENSNDAIIACTLDGFIRSWNLGAERIFGYSAEEAIGHGFHMLIPPDRLDEFPQTLTAVKRGDSLANYETQRLRRDGRKISVSLTDSPIRGVSGIITGLSSIARDITERKRLEEELLQSQKMDAVGRLAGGIAHDFNNILTAILGYSDLIIGQIDERQWMYKHLFEIRKAADFAASLTHQLLAFSRRQPLFLRVFSVNDSVRNMEKMLRRVIGEDIQIVTELNAEIGRLKADPGQLEQVLLNLCVNARDAMPRGGTITITTADVTYLLEDVYAASEMPAGEYVKLTVTDTGTGIPAEVRKHIFEPFFTTK
ncbi:MAG TPA: PAS domain S-box protein, partial [Chthoniobacteraceae bacterium]